MTAVLSFLSAGRGRAPALVAVLALLIGACGRMGPLEPPPNPNAPPKPAAAANSEEALTPMVKPKIPPIVAPQQPFVLDPLLK